jgi:hypothetical protein
VALDDVRQQNGARKQPGKKIFIFSTPVRFAFPVRLGVEGQRSADPADREPWT